MSFQPETSAPIFTSAMTGFLPGCAAAAAYVPAATGLLPNIAAAAAVNTAVISAPLIIDGVQVQPVGNPKRKV
jgi:hypothetical protein